VTGQIADQSGVSPSTESRFRRALKSLSDVRAQTIQMRLFAALLFVLSVLLTFNDHVFAFISTFTDRPELVPMTLMVPYVYLIFQVVLWRLDRDEESESQRLRFAARRSELQERLLERKTVVNAFNRSVESFPKSDKNSGTTALSEWISSEGGSEIEVIMLAYSSETFLDGCLRAASRIEKLIRDSGTEPEKIAFKLLTRDLKAYWRLPFLQNHEADEDYRRALNARFEQFLSRWKVELFEAFAFLPRHKVHLEVRWYHFEPIFKATIVNRKVALVGVYSVHEINHKGVAGWDYHGHGATMYEVRGGDSSLPGGQRALESFVELFDELWNRYSRPVENL